MFKHGSVEFPSPAISLRECEIISCDDLWGPSSSKFGEFEEKYYQEKSKSSCFTLQMGRKIVLEKALPEEEFLSRGGD